MKNAMVKKAFTLIELLVVITIIGILATGATTVYTSQIQKARDSTRVTSIKALQSGVEQFYQDETVYPSKASDWNTANNGVQAYVPTLTEDPKNNQTCNNSRCGYLYAVNKDSNGIDFGAYELSIAFEAKGNTTKKAVNTSDNGDDNDRLEIGIPTTNALLTKQAQTIAFNGAKRTTNMAAGNAVLIVKNYFATK